MKSVKYQLRVEGLPTPDGTISVRALLELLRGLTECAERGLRLAIEGASVKVGRTPAWLDKAVNLVFSGLEKGSTVLDLEAPTLGDVLGAGLQQQDFWNQPPAPDDTALSLFAKSVRDTTAENLESEFYDAGVLRALLNLKPFFKSEAKSAELTAPGRPQEHVVLSMAGMEKAERLKTVTPDPQAFIVSGHLDAIKHSQKRFQLVLPEGKVIPGRINEEFMTAEALRQFWGKEVTINGIVHFKPSGKVQLLQAHLIKPKEHGEEIFGEVPAVQTEAEFVTNAFEPAEKRDWLKEVWGEWPGDESAEEILEGLNR
ncbi:MAG: hypothetical protein HYY24_19555 [Verrucomicrobia bacterium]|nr:hypothetical protein [Verrucomicrobiota bacterium]